MSTLSVTQFKVAPGHGGTWQLANQPPVAVENVSFTGTAGTSAAVDGQVSIIRIVADAACHVSFGTAPTATSSDMYLPANVVEYFGIPIDTEYKVSAIEA